jgi:hypothetical protein
MPLKEMKNEVKKQAKARVKKGIKLTPVQKSVLKKVK